MATVDLVYASDCPNVSLARANMLLAFARAGVKPKWSEHRIGDPQAPEHTRGYGSPSILVDGRDVAGLPPSAEGSCRIYEGAAGRGHVPTAEQIAGALISAQGPMKSTGAGWRSNLAMLPGIGFASFRRSLAPRAGRRTPACSVRSGSAS
jgi:hypothetical protein